MDYAIVDTILSISRDAMLITDDQHRILRVSSVLEKMTGYRAADLVGQDMTVMNSGRHDLEFFTDITREVKAKGCWSGEVWYRLGSGGEQLFRQSIRAINDSDGKLVNYLVTFSKTGELSKSAFDIHRATHDELTELPNRHLLMDRISQAMINGRRAGKSVALLLIGLDNFTRVNDALGQHFGDLVLRETAKRLSQCVRRSDTAARMGGDQFALVTPITLVDDSVIVAEKVLKAINNPYDIDGHSVVLSTSVGISLFPIDADSSDELVERANSAMRHTKKSGGNRYQFFANDMNVKARSRLELENNLRRAIAAEEFLVYYQPKVDVKTCAIVGMEALVRWNDPDRGLIAPNDFIPAAEETGLIKSIGYMVLREACEQNKKWQDMGLKPVRVAVNVSALQFGQPDLVDMVELILSETLLPPKFLELELTESMLMGDVEETVDKMKRLREIGVGLSIDDFGTGYSCLSYLTRFPLTTLKIDRAFVKDLGTNTNTVEIARAIIALSQGLKLNIVAEGAETIEHIEFLKDHECDMVQGFYFSPPVPAAVFEECLKKEFIFVGV